MSERKKKAIKSMMEAVGPKYDSDLDLSKKERKEIGESRDPQETREKIWKKKGGWDKTKKMLKSAWYGDKRKKKD